MTANVLCQVLCDEYGKAATDAMRRELIAANGKVPSHIELYAALALQAGPTHELPPPPSPRKELEQ
jgi:hypothetical protein